MIKGKTLIELLVAIAIDLLIGTLIASLLIMLLWGIIPLRLLGRIP